MPRHPSVQRCGMPVTVATVLCLDIEKEIVTTETVILPRRYKNAKALLEAANRFLNGEGPVKIKANSLKHVELAEADCRADEVDFLRLCSTSSAGAVNIKNLSEKETNK